MISPDKLAFDIDGVFANTMTLFIDIAEQEHNIKGISYEDFTAYPLEDCYKLNVDKQILDAIITKLLDGGYTPTLNPIDGAPEVLTRLGNKHGALLFVTARPHLGPIEGWIRETLPLVDRSVIEIVTTGSFEAKADELLNRNISYFIEDRLETCFLLKEAGITPVLFKQPWNRKKHPFIEIGTWEELESLIDYNDVKTG
jgi:5'(3')-deoxyribonucleotidase